MSFITDRDLHRERQHSPTSIASFGGPVETVPKFSEEPFLILEDIFTATAACVLQIASATSPRVRGLFSGRDTCKPSLREAEHLHTSSRLKCHLFEGRSLGETRANPAFGKPITFTDSHGDRGQRAAIAYTTALSLFSVEFHFAHHDNCRQSTAEQRPSTILATGLRLLLPGAAHRQ